MLEHEESLCWPLDPLEEAEQGVACLWLLEVTSVQFHGLILCASQSVCYMQSSQDLLEMQVGVTPSSLGIRALIFWKWGVGGQGRVRGPEQPLRRPFSACRVRWHPPPPQQTLFSPRGDEGPFQHS